MSSGAAAASRARRALAAIPGMAEATLGPLLADGPTNTTWLVGQAGERSVLRLDKPAAAELGLDRNAEREVCETVAAAGLGPKYAWFDASTGVCLRPYVEGASLAPEDLRDRGTLEALATVLRQLHALPAAGRRFNPLVAARRYAAELGTADAAERAERAADLLASAPPVHPGAALCHNDLVAANILRLPGQGLLLIDWEYAGVGDPYFDLAVVIRHHALDEQLATHFLAAWLERTPGEAERAHLQRQCNFYGVLLDLWNLRIGQ